MARLLASAGVAVAVTAWPAGGQTTPPASAPPTFLIDMHDEVSLSQIIELIRKDQGIQVVYTDDLSNEKVYLPAPVSVAGDRVLDFLILLLEQKGYTLIKNEFGIYMILPVDKVKSIQSDDPYASTQVVNTRGLKPTAVQGFVGTIGGLTNAVYADDIGVIITTDSPGKIRQLRQLIDSIIAAREKLEFTPFEVKHISATAARDRILSLIGEMTQQSGAPGQPPNLQQQGKQAAPTPNAPGGTSAQMSSNLSFQLMVDMQSNSLLFRGRPEERAYIEQLLAMVDVPNKMRSVFYETGVRAAEVIAFQGAREGLGDVTTYQSTTEDEQGLTGLAGARQQQPGQQFPGQQGLQGGVGQNQPQSNSAGFVIYPEAGGFMYHGTVEQHARIAQLSKDLKQLSQGDLVTMEFYKLKHAKAEDVVGIIGSLLGESTGAGNTGSILGSDLSRTGGRQPRERQSSRSGAGQAGTGAGTTGGGGLGAVGNEETTVIEDYKNNQVIVKTRQRLQGDFAKLIQRLDSRRPQVYVNAQIVAVTDNQSNRLAVETQIIAGQFGLNTDFGLGELDDILQRKSVGTGLPALTAAIVRSDSVPFIITAIQSNTDSKILATPQLLVDDNEAASVVSENVVPTLTTSQTSNGNLQSVGEPARAGTTLEVTPQISENAVKLDIYIEQSAFTGEATENLPPPSQENFVQSLVTVPRDCTIVIGGLTFESDTKTIVKVPLLGDIPLAGLLFRDTVSRRQRTTLYVFLTPTIMTDPTFADLRLLTKGPAAESRLDSEHIMPPPSLVRMEIGNPILPAPLPEPILLEPRPLEPEPAPAAPAPTGPRPTDPMPINGTPRPPEEQPAEPNGEKKLKP